MSIWVLGIVVGALAVAGLCIIIAEVWYEELNGPK